MKLFFLIKIVLIGQIVQPLCLERVIRKERSTFIYGVKSDLNNGAPIDVNQSLLGHEKSETTRIYAQLSGSVRREFYRKYF